MRFVPWNISDEWTTNCIMTAEQGSSTIASYDNKLACDYSYFEKQHFHSDGPYHKITNIVAERAKLMMQSSPLVVLDLASGPGEPAATIAKALPDATVYSTDCSESMNLIAQKRVADISNLKAAVVDMQDLSPLFQNESVDFVTCCYGIIFPQNKKKALEESFRVLKSGGMYINTFFIEIPHYDLFRAVLEHVLDGSPDKPPTFDPLFFEMPVPNLLEAMLKDVGYTDIQTIVSTYPIKFSNDPDFFLNVLLSFDADKIIESVPNGKEKVIEVLPLLLPKYMHVEEDGTLVSQKCVFKCVVATKP